MSVKMTYKELGSKFIAVVKNFERNIPMNDFKVLAGARVEDYEIIEKEGFEITLTLAIRDRKSNETIFRSDYDTFYIKEAKKHIEEVNNFLFSQDKLYGVLMPKGVGGEERKFGNFKLKDIKWD